MGGYKGQSFFRFGRYWEPVHLTDDAGIASKIEALSKEVDEELKDEIHLWKLVAKGVVSWQELNEYYTVDDVIRLEDTLALTNRITEICTPQPQQGE